MLVGYSKLFSDIVHSTVWREPMHIKIVWITMLAMSDRHGQVQSSIPGLADSSKVSLNQCLEALDRLSGPDKYSRTKDYEGRRITDIDGGWLILNYEKYRARKDDEEQRIRTRERVRRHRERANVVTENVTVTRSNPIAEAESEAESITTLSSEARHIIEFLNEKTGRKYQPLKVNVDFITARLKEGYTTKQLRQIIARKCSEWGRDDKMNKYLRPATLFNREKCAQYAGELAPPKEIT